MNGASSTTALLLGVIVFASTSRRVAGLYRMAPGKIPADF
jgi:hypothetical protein